MYIVHNRYSWSTVSVDLVLGLCLKLHNGPWRPLLILRFLSISVRIWFRLTDFPVYFFFQFSLSHVLRNRVQIGHYTLFWNREVERDDSIRSIRDLDTIVMRWQDHHLVGYVNHLGAQLGGQGCDQCKVTDSKQHGNLFRSSLLAYYSMSESFSNMHGSNYLPFTDSRVVIHRILIFRTLYLLSVHDVRLPYLHNFFIVAE